MIQTVTHTPGPWATDGLCPLEALFIIASDRTGRFNDIYIAEVAVADEEDRIAPTQAERNANARLMAASPELLEALESAAQEIEHWMMGCDKEDESSAAVLDIARAAIAKAYGEDHPEAGNPVTGTPEDQRRLLKARVCEIIDAMESYPSLTDIAHALYRAAGYQPFPWHKDDIQCAWADKHGAEIEDCPLSDAACMDILERMHHGHDASIGINWDVIACYLDEAAS